jgi:signal transduction histidine kinase
LSPSIPGAKILYIDDDPVNRSLVNRLLSSYDFQIIEAGSGLEGISIARKERPHLILMDINMPGLDGHETTTRMRGIPALENTPIIALTARTTRGERELALAAGCDGYISKPIDIDDFPGQVVSYLDGYKDTISNDERQRYLGQYSHKLVERLEAKVVELQEANERLQKIDKIKSDFITLAAHELRTPITLVYGYARLLQSATQLEEPSGIKDVNELASSIYHSVHRLTEVVNDILNISLIEAGEMLLEEQPVNLAEVVEAALLELNPAKHDRQLDIRLERLEDLPVIAGDKQRLQQVFWNLLSNAIKFTPDNGFILVKGWLVSGDRLPDDLEIADPAAIPAGQQGVVVMVEDTGTGIDRSEQKEIFERFYVVENTAYHSSSKTAFRGGGIGLGLPIARGIIEAHGGRIWVESAGRPITGKTGSKFFVFLPYDENAIPSYLC